MSAALVALLALGCRERYRPVLEARDGAAPDLTSARDVVEVVDAPSRTEEPWARLSAPSGAVTVDTSLRVVDGRVSEGQAIDGRALLPGDQALTGDDSAVALVLAGDARVELGANAHAEVPGYAGASLVLSQGVASVTSPIEARDPVRVDTPAGRVIVSGGRAIVAVADDGSVRVSAEEGTVTVWPSPPAPPERATSLSPEERRRRTLASPGHPVLLDVDLPELAAAELRALSSRPLAPGASLAWTSRGDLARGALPRASGVALRSAVEAWTRSRNASLRRPDGHLVAIDEVSRAGAGDVADLRVALARLRTHLALTERARDGLLSSLSLALGRLSGRARRGRALATRGGNVTALVQTAPLEELRDAARQWAPLIAPSR